MLRIATVALVLLSACAAHAPTAPSPSGEILATPPALAEARASWVASTVRLARTEMMQGRFERARTLLESALDRAAAEGDSPGKARLQAELGLVLSEESFYTRTDAERGVQLAQAAQASARSQGALDVEARAVHAEGFLRYGELLWAEGKDFHVPRERFARARDLFREAGDASGVAQETFFLGLTEEQEGKPERAEPLYVEARQRAEEIGDRSTQAYALRHLGGLAESRGDLDQALALQRRCLALREEIGQARLVPFALHGRSPSPRNSAAHRRASGRASGSAPWTRRRGASVRRWRTTRSRSRPRSSWGARAGRRSPPALPRRCDSGSGRHRAVVEHRMHPRRRSPVHGPARTAVERRIAPTKTVPGPRAGEDCG